MIGYIYIPRCYCCKRFMMQLVMLATLLALRLFMVVSMFVDSWCASGGWEVMTSYYDRERGLFVFAPPN